jgi:hypothetical protein
MPAGKKVSGFVSHHGRFGCNRCEVQWIWVKDSDASDDDDEAKDGEGDNTNDGGLVQEEGKEEKRSNHPVHRDRLAPSKDGDVKKNRGPRGRTQCRNVAVLGRPRSLSEHRRTAERWRTATNPSQQAKIVRACGVKYSVLLQLDYFDPITMTVIDAMHAFWLGVCKEIMKHWRDTKWKKNTAGAKELVVMQGRLDAMEIPSDFCRILSKWASNMSHLNAGQIKAFVGCFSRVVYRGYLSDDESQLWEHLIVASRLMSQYQLNQTELAQVRHCFAFFSTTCMCLSDVSVPVGVCLGKLLAEVRGHVSVENKAEPPCHRPSSAMYP